MRKLISLSIVALVVLTLSMTISTVKAETAGSSPTTLNTTNLLLVSCDKNGNKKDVFQLNENVYVKGGYFIFAQSNGLVDIYVVANGVIRGEPVPASSIVSSAIAVQLSGKSLPVTKIWDAPLKKGKYDVWVDVNRNGKLDSKDAYFYLGIESFTESSYQVSCGPIICDTSLFTVVPESYMGVAGTIAAMIGALAIFRLKAPNISKKHI
ncbi:MAG: hypothetical protein ABSB28_01875 [Candidatus Bathyarchaeia archaeon]